MTAAAVWLGSAIVAALLIAALLFLVSGGRWFIVQTPSMGTAAPVGTLLFDSPATVSSLAVGDIISFHPPTAPSEVYTHRIVDISAAGISTRGDVNGATDPWLLHQNDLIGKSVAIVPDLGWIIRAIPFLAIGTAVVIFLALLFRSPTTRATVRVVGFSFVAAITAMILRPFVNLVVETTRTTTQGAEATLVSTGMLPIRITALGGEHLDLASGQLGKITAPVLAESGHYGLSSALNLPFFGWVVFGLICAIPLLWTLVVGLPYEQDDREVAATP